MLRAPRFVPCWILTSSYVTGFRGWIVAHMKPRRHLTITALSPVFRYEHSSRPTAVPPSHVKGKSLLQRGLVLISPPVLSTSQWDVWFQSDCDRVKNLRATRW